MPRGLGRLREGHGGGAMCLWESQCIVCPCVGDSEWVCCSRCSAMYQPLPLSGDTLLMQGSHGTIYCSPPQLYPHSRKQFPACILSSPHSVYSSCILFQIPSPTSRDWKNHRPPRVCQSLYPVQARLQCRPVCQRTPVLPSQECWVAQGKVPFLEQQLQS